jgi:hypothetical protein
MAAGEVLRHRRTTLTTADEQRRYPAAEFSLPMPTGFENIFRIPVLIDLANIFLVRVLMDLANTE